METGSPSPQIYVNESLLLLTYRLHNPDLHDATTTNDVEAYLAAKGRHALFTFSHALVHCFGWPNNEVLHAHPLYERGLGFYGVFEVQQSSWIRQLEKGNSIHFNHQAVAGWLDRYHHYIITLHDNTFECVARGYQFQIVEDPAEPLRNAIQSEI